MVVSIRSTLVQLLPDRCAKRLDDSFISKDAKDAEEIAGLALANQ